MASMGLNLDEQKAVDRFRTEVVEPSMTKLVVLDFWAEWCGPCKQIAPALDELSDEYASKLTIVKINIDENPVAPTDHNVRSIPTMMIFQDGVVSATKIGAAPKGQIKDWIDETL